MNQARILVEAILDHFKPGAVVYIPGAIAELPLLRDLLTANPDRLDGVTLVSGLIPGVNTFDYAALSDDRETHSAGSIDDAPFIAINSAIEVDLFGQLYLEWRGDRWMSGIGGASDFARAAKASAGGRSIIALPATAASGSISRIVGRLTTPTVSLPRNEADPVVTEHGHAVLAALDTDRRADALIAISAPAHRITYAQLGAPSADDVG